MLGINNAVSSLKAAEREVLAQLAGIRAAISSLSGGGGMPTPFVRRRGRPAGKPVVRKRRRLSAKARKAISDAQKARWAKQKAAAKK